LSDQAKEDAMGRTRSTNDEKQDYIYDTGGKLEENKPVTRPRCR
jgi:hypothetical protein